MKDVKYKRVNKCILCNRQTMIFTWSTSRVFLPYQQKLSNLLSYIGKVDSDKPIIGAVLFGVPVCKRCFCKLKRGGKIVRY